jgi:hypothetical protein
MGDTTPEEKLNKRRIAGAYIWRENTANLQQICEELEERILGLIVGSGDEALRRSLRECLDMAKAAQRLAAQLKDF